MGKLMKIENCGECRNLENLNKFGYVSEEPYQCKLTKKKIKDTHQIDEDCPLEDAL